MRCAAGSSTGPAWWRLSSATREDRNPRQESRKKIPALAEDFPQPASLAFPEPLDKGAILRPGAASRSASPGVRSIAFGTPAQQKIDQARVTLRRRVVEWSQAPVVPMVDKRSSVQQEPRDMDMAACRRIGQRRPPLIANAIQLRAREVQLLENVFEPELRGHHQGRHAELVGGIRIRIQAKQDLESLGLSLVTRHHQRGVAALVLVLEPGTCLDQELDDLRVVTVTTGVMQRSLTPGILGIDIGLARYAIADCTSVVALAGPNKIINNGLAYFLAAWGNCPGHGSRRRESAVRFARIRHIMPSGPC